MRARTKRLWRRLVSGVLAAVMLAALLPTAAYAAVGDLVRNSAVENAALLEALEEAYGSDAETYYAILEEYGLLDEDGNLVTDEEIVVDGEAYTLDEIEDVLDDPNTDLDQVAEVDGQHITLADLKTIIEIERYLAYVKATYFTEQELTQAQVNSFYDLADAWAGGEVRLLSANALTETGPAGVDHSVRLSVTAADTANENSTYTVTVKASASSAAPDQAITFSWRAVSGSVVATGGAQNVTLKPGESVKLQVNTGRVTGKLNGKATFLVQIYDVTNALFSDGSTRWEKSVSVSRSDMTMEHTNVYQNTSGVLNNGNLTVNGCEIADNISTGGVDIDNRGTLSISADTEYRGFYKTDTGEEVTLPLSEYSDPAMFVCLTEEQAKEYFAPPATPDEEPTPVPEPTPEPDVEEPTTTPEPTPDPSEDDIYTPPSRPSRPSRPAQLTTEKEPVTEQDVAPVFACGDAVIDVSRSVVLQGYGDGLLHLEDYLTRGQMATIIYRLLDDDTLEKYDTADSVFSDVPKDSWCCRYVSTIANAGIVAGVGNGNFNPNSRLTWAHILTVLTRFVTAQDYALQSIHYDGWALKSVKTAVALGWIEDTANFNPNAPITRGEFTDLVNGVLALYQTI